MRAFINETQKGVTGTVRLKLYKGNCSVAGRKSERSLYMKDFATFDKDAVYDQKDASGFIRLNALEAQDKGDAGRARIEDRVTGSKGHERSRSVLKPRNPRITSI